MRRTLQRVAFIWCTMIGAPFALAEDAATYPPEFGEMVRQYLLDNPQVILEAMDVLSRIQSRTEMAERVAPHYETLSAAGVRLRLGAVDAQTVIFEFFDYRCAVCKAVAPELERFVDAHPNVAIIKKHLPILTPGSERAARYVLSTDALYGSDASHSVHTALYSTNAPMREAVFETAATALGLDHGAIQAGTQAEEITAEIDRNREVAIALGITGTPAFLAPKSLKVGAVTMDDLEKLASTP